MRASIPLPCLQVVENGTNWKVDVYVTCTSGVWDNSVQSIIVHGEAFQPNAVDGVLPAASVAIADLVSRGQAEAVVGLGSEVCSQELWRSWDKGRELGRVGWWHRNVSAALDIAGQY